MPGLRDDAVEQIRARVDIVDVISEYLTIRRAGRNYVALCPFHTEDTPSFTVSPDKQMFYCFGCQVGGDVFTFIMKKEGVEFREALRILARRAGVELGYESFTPAQRQNLRRQAQIYKVLENAARYFEHLFQTDPSAAMARRYVAQRGISEETAKAFRLGWSRPGWNDLHLRFRRQGVSEEILLAAGLTSKGQGGRIFDRFRGRLMFPITDARGRVVGFGARAMAGDAQPKYLNSPESTVFRKRQLLYGFDRAREAIRQKGQVLIVEGYTDVISAHQAGFTYAVASLGTALSQEQVRRLTPLAERIFVAYDADAAGQKATLRGLEQFTVAAPDAEVMIVTLPEGYDPDTFIRRYGAGEFARQLDNAQPLFDYLFDQACRQFDINTIPGKAKVVAFIAPWLARLRNEVLFSAYVRRFADRLQIDEGALRVEIRKQVEKSRPEQRGREETGPVVKNGHKPANARHTINVAGGSLIQGKGGQLLPGHVRAERELLRVMVNSPEQAAKIASRVEIDNFTESGSRSIASVVFRLAAGRDHSARDENIHTGLERSWEQQLLEAVADPEARALVARWLVQGLPPGDVDAVVDGCVEYLLRYRDERRARQLWRDISEREQLGQEVPKDWLIEYQQLQRELRR